MAKVQFSETLTVAQLPQETIPDNIQKILENNACFDDTNETLNEKLISLGTVEDLEFNMDMTKSESDYFADMLKEMSKVGASYVQIVKV